MTRIVWTRPAVADLEAIREFVEVNDARAAARVVRRILAPVRRLGAAPHLGRPGRVPGTRELGLVRVPYILAYRVTAGVVEILRVLHTSRRWPRRLP